MPVLTAINNTNSNLALNSVLGSLPPRSLRKWDLSTDQLEGMSALLVNLRNAGVISFEIASTESTDDDDIEMVRRDEIFGQTPLGKFVSQEGSDEDGDGSRDLPYATVERALADYPIRIESVMEGSTYPLYVVWVVAPYEVDAISILIPARTGGTPPNLDLSPMGLDTPLGYIDFVIVASWSEHVDAADDPRWDVEETVEISGNGTLYDRHLYDLTGGFSASDNAHTGKTVRAFKTDGSESFRGIVQSNTTGPDKLVVEVGGTTSPADIGDTLQICRPTVRCDTMTVRGGGHNVCLMVLGFEVKATTVYHGTCVDFVGCNLVGGNPPPFSDTLDIYPYSSVGLKEGAEVSFALGAEFEAAGLPEGELAKWTSWPTSALAPSIDEVCVRIRALARFVHQGLSLGVIKSKDGPGEIDMKEGATLFGHIEMDGTGRFTSGDSGACVFGRMSGSTYNAAIKLGPLVSASIQSAIVVDADTMGDKVLMELRGATVGGNDTLVWFGPWTGTVNMTSTIVSMIDGATIHADPNSILRGGFGGGGGSDISFDTGSTYTWEDLDTAGRLIEGLSLVTKFS